MAAGCLWILFLCISCIYIPKTAAQLSFATYYGNSMVLQRAPAAATLWGYGVAEGNVVDGTLSVGGTIVQTFQTTVISEDSVLVWRAQLEPVQAGGPYDITVTSAGQSLTLTDVLFGDVWFCSGQSNMQHQMNQIDNAQIDINDSVNYQNVRTFFAGFQFSANQEKDLLGVAQNWTRPNTALIPAFSALCWFFGRNLYNTLQIPIGLIETCWGGTRIEAWASPDALQQCYGADIPPGTDQNAPSVLYNAMIHPLFPMPVFGGIWYQGESNTGNSDDYACLLKNMVHDWRDRWFASTEGQTDPDFPFGVAQLSGYRYADTVGGFPMVRWAQAGLTGKLPNSEFVNFFMAVTMDLPDDNSPTGSIHPRYKRQVAERLSLAGLGVAYGRTDVGRYEGPIPASYLRLTYEGQDAIEMTMDDPTVEMIMTDYFVIGFEVCCAYDPAYFCSTDWSLVHTLAVTPGKVTIAVLCDYPPPYITGVRYAWRQTPVLKVLQGHLYTVDNNLPVPSFIYIGNVTTSSSDK